MTRYISPDRKQQVKTTRARHGKDFYKEIGKKSSGAGQTFKDPLKASEAAKIRWANERRKRDAAKDNEQRLNGGHTDVENKSLESGGTSGTSLA